MPRETNCTLSNFQKGKTVARFLVDLRVARFNLWVCEFEVIVYDSDSQAQVSGNLRGKVNTIEKQKIYCFTFLNPFLLFNKV